MQVMIATILSADPAMLVVVVINADASGYSNLLCHTDIDKHWSFSKQTVEKVTLHLSSAPQVANVSNWREVSVERLPA